MNLFRGLGKFFCATILVPCVGIGAGVGTYLGIITLITMTLGTAATGVGIPIAFAIGALAGVVAMSTSSRTLWDKFSYYGQKIDNRFNERFNKKKFYQNRVKENLAHIDSSLITLGTNIASLTQDITRKVVETKKIKNTPILLLFAKMLATTQKEKKILKKFVTLSAAYKNNT